MGIARVHDKSVNLSKRDFLAKAVSLPDRVVKDIVAQAKPQTFSTGSFGWHACTKKPINVHVAGVCLPVIVNFTAVLKGTKQSENNARSWFGLCSRRRKVEDKAE